MLLHHRLKNAQEFFSESVGSHVKVLPDWLVLGDRMHFMVEIKKNRNLETFPTSFDGEGIHVNFLSLAVSDYFGQAWVFVDSLAADLVLTLIYFEEPSGCFDGDQGQLFDDSLEHRVQL